MLRSTEKHNYFLLTVMLFIYITYLENAGSRESLSDAVPEPLPEKLPPKKKSIEPQGPTVNERELVAGALVPIAERDR